LKSMKSKWITKSQGRSPPGGKLRTNLIE